MRAACLVLGLAVALALTACGDESSAELRSCADVGFTPGSDDIAVHIRARNVACADARAFVRDSEGRPGDTFRGFICTRRVISADELPHTNWRCADGERVIRWQRY